MVYLHTRVLKEAKTELSHPLSIIYNNSLTSENLPTQWKVGNITAIYIKKSSPGYYRPVSLTSVPCKIMEFVVRYAIINHMLKSKLFSNQQYVFIAGRSTSLQLLKVLDEWTKTLDEGGMNE